MAGVVITVLLLQLIHAGPTSSLLAAELGPCRRITVLVAGAQSATGVQIHRGRGICARAAAHRGGAAGRSGRVLPGAHLPRLRGYAGHSDGGDRQLHARVPPEVGGTLLVTGLLRLADVPTMYMWCRGDSLAVILHPDCTAVRDL